MRGIKRIFVHCTAGSQRQTVADLQAEFKRKGWKNPGYHYVIQADGTVKQLLGEQFVSNGVKGYNSTSVNVAYMGGIDADGKAVDNRTDAQKASLLTLLKELKERYPKAEILGHRDISPDTNGNGIVDPWERIKECPCFNARDEYKDL
jgi:N-acetyl-anhydromuramyl-L-alanine amidase AmpD|nr:MAG TPA: endodeoxyribonuclease I [Caudoviricetes sp.]